MAKKKPRPKPVPFGKQPFDPLASPYQTNNQFNAAVNKRAGAQIATPLNDVKQRINEAKGAHTTRSNELQAWYGNANQVSQAADDTLNQRLQGLLGSVGSYDGGANAALSAAIRQSAADVGGGTQANPSYANALAAYGGGNQMSLVGDVAGDLTRSAAERNILATAGREAGDAESRRADAVMDALTKERTGVKAQLPGIREEVRNSMLNTAMQQAGQDFQQNLASKQFGLSKKQFGLTKKQFQEQKRSQRFQEGLAGKQFGEDARHNRVSEAQQQQQLDQGFIIDTMNAQTARQQLKQDIANAKTDTEKNNAVQRADAFNSGITAIQKWLTPSKAEQRKNGTTKSTYKRKFNDGYDMLIHQVGMPPMLALKALAAFPAFRQEAYKRIKILRVKQHVKPMPPVAVKPNDLPGLSDHIPG